MVAVKLAHRGMKVPALVLQIAAPCVVTACVTATKLVAAVLRTARVLVKLLLRRSILRMACVNVLKTVLMRRAIAVAARPVS